jgi:hypothetical protein
MGYTGWLSEFLFIFTTLKSFLCVFPYITIDLRLYRLQVESKLIPLQSYDSATRMLSHMGSQWYTFQLCQSL